MGKASSIASDLDMRRVVTALERLALAGERIADALEGMAAQDPLAVIEQALANEQAPEDTGDEQTVEDVLASLDPLSHIPAKERWRFDPGHPDEVPPDDGGR